MITLCLKTKANGKPCTRRAHYEGQMCATHYKAQIDRNRAECRANGAHLAHQDHSYTLQTSGRVITYSRCAHCHCSGSPEFMAKALA